MIRRIPQLFLSLLCCSFACAACAKNPEITDPAEAAKDPSYAIQGEYAGQGVWIDGTESKAGAQVIAQGDGKFNIVVTQGGLPGDGWKRGQSRIFLQGKREAEVTTLTSQGISGKIAGELMTLASADGKAKLELKRTVRHSPTEGAKAPEGAIVLFDGKTAENFHHGTLTADKNLLSEATTKRKFGDYSLHLEFRLSYMPQARGQGRSNSGVYLHDCYETQVLDSFGLEGADNECGGFYQLRKPDVNMCFPPLTWQTYDFNFTAPKYQGGKKTANARVSVKHNGVEIHPEFELARNTPGRQGEAPAPRPFYLQGHGNKVAYRNIWLVEKK
ncbi:MAG: DUF1080 domain-containing protein [Planctomycetota bacterium]